MVKGHFIIMKKNESDTWDIIDRTTNKTVSHNLSKRTALSESENFRDAGKVVVVCDKNGITDVLEPKRPKGAVPIRRAPVKRNRSDREVKIAIVKALNICQ